MAYSSELCQLIMYSGSSVVGNKGSEIGGGNWCLESTNSVLDPLSNLYSELNIFLCKD